MLLCQSTRPNASIEVLQRLRFADALERISHDRFDQIESAQRGFSILLHPVPQIIPELWVKNGDAILMLRQDQPRFASG